MKKINFMIVIFIPFILGMNYNQNNLSETKIIQNGDLLYLSNVINAKFKEIIKYETGLMNIPLMNKILNTIKVAKVEQIFPSKDNSNKLSIELSKIHRIYYEGNIDPLELSSKIKSLTGIEYAEPHYVYRVDFTPNDPEYGGQSNLTKINASSAWDISKGDSSIVIGIIDTGIYWNHPDLSANIWINKNEIPNNGIDDDNNGYVDDVRGWDFGGLNGNPDNDPKEDQPDHGTHVAGIASASTNNGIGIASIGFKCKVMAVKTSRNDQRDPSTGQPYIVYGYEGIKYAADNGAAAINCSWGGSGYSSMAQEVIDYASSKGSLVVAAAGNNGTLGDFFPASYDKVLSVASTNLNDTKSSFSNYGYTVDVCAPG
ncbi:MAG: S8 family serine peptidase, partial [Ignavibacteria bacterium]|nr:S8 family serine peptidase [Ignavibacteria bacterium]